LQATNQPITVYGDGKQTRSFCYITDTVTGLILLTSPKANGEDVNVDNTIEVTILELAKKVKEACKSRIEFHPLPKDDLKDAVPTQAK
jgi:nucleoside-diphosphate-sugar epimerase